MTTVKSRPEQKAKSKLLKTSMKTEDPESMPMWQFTKWCVACSRWDLCAPQFCHLQISWWFATWWTKCENPHFLHALRKQAPLKPCSYESSVDGASFAPIRAYVRPKGTPVMPLHGFAIGGKQCENHNFRKSHENRRPWDHAHVKVQEMVRRLHLLKPMCDQMTSQLCRLQIPLCFAIWWKIIKITAFENPRSKCASHVWVIFHSVSSRIKNVRPKSQQI